MYRMNDRLFLEEQRLLLEEQQRLLREMSTQKMGWRKLGRLIQLNALMRGNSR